MSIANSWSLRFAVNTDSYLRIDITPTFFPFNQTQMIEVSLFGIVLGLIPITLAGLFITAYLQYRRGDQLDLWLIHISSFDWPLPLFNPQEVKFEFLCKWLLNRFQSNSTHEEKITLCRIWTYDIGFWRPTFYRTELRALSYKNRKECKQKNKDSFFNTFICIYSIVSKKWMIPCNLNRSRLIPRYCSKKQ